MKADRIMSNFSEDICPESRSSKQFVRLIKKEAHAQDLWRIILIAKLRKTENTVAWELTNPMGGRGPTPKRSIHIF